MRRCCWQQVADILKVEGQSPLHHAVPIPCFLRLEAQSSPHPSLITVIHQKGNIDCIAFCQRPHVASRVMICNGMERQFTLGQQCTKQD